MFLSNSSNDVSILLTIAIILIGALIIIVGIISSIVSIVLAISYVKYNRTKNSANITGADAARLLLDKNGLQDIKVKVGGSLIFGNSYSHYFKKIRLRRLTKNKTSITSLAIGAEKTALAILDKENDADVRKRVKLVPFVTFGPLAFIPLILIGAILDLFILKSEGLVLLIVAIIGILLFGVSVILAFVTLKSEKKAQKRALELLRENDLATEEETNQMVNLFKLYNIQYINDLIISVLELIRFILQIMASVAKNSKSSNN